MYIAKDVMKKCISILKSDLADELKVETIGELLQPKSIIQEWLPPPIQYPWITYQHTYKPIDTEITCTDSTGDETTNAAPTVRIRKDFPQ